MSPVKERRGLVKELEGEKATLAMEDGSELVVTAPEVVCAKVGMKVTVIETEHGRPVLRWGA